MSLRDWVIYTTGDDGRITWRTVSAQEMYERRLAHWARKVEGREEGDGKPWPSPPRIPA